jgi:hypothetical protein
VKLNSPPLGAEIKNAWIYTSTPQYDFMSWCLVKHRDNFTFYLYLYMSWLCYLVKQRDNLYLDGFISFSTVARISLGNGYTYHASKKEELGEVWRRLHNEDLHNLLHKILLW